uniref:Uncharacterized protein n=1 Tax=Steinernema glaseri TaxID=37863 RepID=A0A1I7ZFP1_9BILA
MKALDNHWVPSANRMLKSNTPPTAVIPKTYPIKRKRQRSDAYGVAASSFARSYDPPSLDHMKKRSVLELTPSHESSELLDTFLRVV